MNATRRVWRATLLLMIGCLTLGSCEGDPGRDATPGPPEPEDVVDALAPELDSGEEVDTPEPPAPPEPVVTPLLESARISSQPGSPNFHRVSAPFFLDATPYASVRLQVELGTTCYPFTSWRREDIPEGHRWPSHCDAFDRNFEILLRQVDAPEDQPLFEVERAITPFGGPMSLEVDITDLANARPGAWELIVHISTWSDGGGQVTGSDGGWNIDAGLHVAVGPPPRPVLDVLPLHNGNLTRDEPRALVRWTNPEEVRSVRLEYRTTGHGGGADPGNCLGPAEEFCRRFHALYVDGRALATLRPWREDCEALCTLLPFPGQPGSSYCAENPTGAIPSVRAPRANWCPGDVTPPFVWEDEVLALPGERSVEVEISHIAPGGSWRTSLLVYLYGEAPLRP